MNKVILRQANSSDIDAIMKVEKNSFIAQIQENRDVFLKRIMICPSLFLLFQKEDENHTVIGYLSAEYMNKIPESPEELKLGHVPSTEKGKFIYISSFAILPEFRQIGLGKKLWNQAIKYFGDEKDYLLLVNEEWNGAMHIYEESGFILYKTFPDFFPSINNGTSDGHLLVKIR